MSEEKPRLSRRELRERGLLAPITEGPSPLEERVRQRDLLEGLAEVKADAIESGAPGERADADAQSEPGRSSVFDRFVSDDDEAPADVADGSVGSGVESASLEERLLARVREDGLADETGEAEMRGESRALEVADAVVDTEIVTSEYDREELAEPKRHNFLLLFVFILIGLAIGFFATVGWRSLNAYPDGEISPTFSVAVLQTVDSLLEENSVSI
ncbi:MAG: hypothetical protein QM705_15660 [Ancrocorticia sp.]